MKKIFLSLFSTSLILFSSIFAYACNTLKKDPNEVKKDENTKSSVPTKNYEIYDQNFINEQIKQENETVQNQLQEQETNRLSSNEELESDQVFKNDPNNLRNQTVDSKEKNDSVNQQTPDTTDPFTLLSQITWQFLEDAQVRNLISQIEANQIYQNLIAKINSPVSLLILDDNIVKSYSDYLQTKQYTASLNYVIKNSLYPKVEKTNFKFNVMMKQLDQKQIHEQIANKYCDLIALWNKDSLHLSSKEWNENFNFYIVESLIKDIKTNAKTYVLIDNEQVIDDLAILIFNNNKPKLENKDIIENQLYNVEVKVKIGQGNDQVIKWTSFMLDFKKAVIQQK